MDGPRLLIGVLHDFPTPDGGAAFEWGVRRGFAEVDASGRLPGPLEFVHEAAFGLPLPGGSARSVEDAFRALDAAGVLAVLGPAISDNAIVTRPLSDAAGLATINYTGGEETRSQYGFHFQIGSLEDEPSFLAAHLLERGLRRVALIQDTSYIGRRMADFFLDACAASGLALVSRTAAPTNAPDATDAVAIARGADPDALVTLGLWDLPHAVTLELRAIGWDVPTSANSALIYGHHDPQWARDWEGWTYIDTVSEQNPRYVALIDDARAAGQAGGPGTAGAYDMGRLLAEGIARAHGVTREAIAQGLDRVKSLPSATGRPDTLMGFGRYDRGALKGQYLVIRQWRDGASVEW
ncbi:MAG: ABC transporter substrate-binding protein [Acidimicrobiia bacterium]|jgi:ABC-type branched-subunit amino acid transport system substrate-binding protein